MNTKPTFVATNAGTLKPGDQIKWAKGPSWTPVTVKSVELLTEARTVPAFGGGTMNIEKGRLVIKLDTGGEVYPLPTMYCLKAV